jgi:glycosyltransferase involved in cell wall biosynthesis
VNTRRTVLIVSYYFAPSPAVGARRFSYLAREFERLGYDVHIITHEMREWTYGKADESLPLAGHVHRCTSIRLPFQGKGFFARAANALLRKLLAPVGWEYFWARAATCKALEVARTLPAGIVIATSPAHAAAIAGSRIARKLGWPLILDYRDPWSAYEWPRWRKSPVSQWFSRRIERRLVRHSAARVLNTPAMLDWFEKFFPCAPGTRNFVIPNGFDAAPAVTAPEPPSPEKNAPIEIVHAGEIFAGRSLVPVLKAMQRVSARHPGRALLLTTYGDLPAVEAQRIRDASLEGVLQVRPRIPFSELFGVLQRAHLLLAIVSDHMLYSTPYKVYDYMATGRPILGLAPEGAALFNLLSDSGAGLCLEPGDDIGIETALERLLSGDVSAVRARVDRFRWSNLALQYRNVIETVAGTTAPAAAHDDGRTRDALDI